MAQMVDIRRYDRPPWLPTKVKAVAVNRISTKTKQNVKYMRMPHDASCDIYFDPYNCLQHYVNEKVERYSYVAPACMFFWDSGHLAVAQHDQVMLPRWRSGRWWAQVLKILETEEWNDPRCQVAPCYIITMTHLQLTFVVDYPPRGVLSAMRCGRRSSRQFGGRFPSVPEESHGSLELITKASLPSPPTPSARIQSPSLVPPGPLNPSWMLPVPARWPLDPS